MTNDQLIRNIGLLEQQGATPQEVQEYINTVGTTVTIPQVPSFRPQQVQAPSGFDFRAAGDVFKRAGEDVRLAFDTGVADEPNLFKRLLGADRTARTAILQGGLAPFRAVGEGITGSRQGQFITGNVVDRLTDLGEAITPQSVQDWVGKNAREVIAGYEGMSPNEQLRQRNRLALAEILSYALGGPTASKAVVTGTEVTRRGVGRLTEAITGAATRQVDDIPFRRAPEVSPEVTRLADNFYKGLAEESASVSSQLSKVASRYRAPDTPGTTGVSTFTERSLLRELVENGVFPTIRGRLADFTDAVGRLTDEQSQIGSLIDTRLANRPEITDLNDLKAEAEAILVKSPQLDATLDNSLSQLDAFFKGFQAKAARNPEFKPGKLNAKQMNQIRVNMNRKTRSFRQAEFSQDVADAVADAIRNRLDIIDPNVRRLNQRWGQLQRIKATTKAVQMKPVNIGILGTQLGRLGATLGLGTIGLATGAGSLVIAGIVAHFGGQFVARILRQRLISPKSQKVIIDALKKHPTFAQQLINDVAGEDKALLINALSDKNPELKFETLEPTDIPVTGLGDQRARRLANPIQDRTSFQRGETPEQLGRQDLPEDNRPTLGLATQDRGAFGRGEQEVFNNFPDLTAKHLSNLEGKSTVSKQFILDTANRPELKQPERDLIRAVVDEFPDGKINVQEYANKIKARLLPLEVPTNWKGVTQHESVTLDPEIRGDVSQYGERIYQSPIKNSAGSVHYSNYSEKVDSYFAHTRIEDMADGETRRVIEVQSDLFQKGRVDNLVEQAQFRLNDVQEDLRRDTFLLENEARRDNFTNEEGLRRNIDRLTPLVEERKQGVIDAEKGLAQLQPYRNTWWERIVREEVRQAAQDGKTTLQFPTGETAMKIEGLHRAGISDDVSVGDVIDFQGDDWMIISNNYDYADAVPLNQTRSFSYDDFISDEAERFSDVDELYDELNWSGIRSEIANNQELLEAHDLVMGRAAEPDGGEAIIKKELEEKFDITDLADSLARERYPTRQSAIEWLEDNLGGDGKHWEARNSNDFEIVEYDANYLEQIPLGDGDLDTSNPIYKFYEKDMQKYLTKNYGAKMVTDENGVTWVEMDVPKDAKKLPVEAFGIGAALYGASQLQEE